MTFSPSGLRKLVLSSALLLAAASLVSVWPQTEEFEAEPILVDEFGRVNECDFGGRIDTFLAELSSKSEFQGYIINYKGADELPGEKNSYLRERTIVNHIGFRNFDRSRITIVRGGYRDQASTELWMLPSGVTPPAPSKTIPEPKTPEGTTLLFAKNYLDLESEGSMRNEYVLPSVLVIDAEQIAETESAADEPADDSDTSDSEQVSYVDNRSDGEKEAEKFQWVEVGIAEFVRNRAGSTAVIFFYADDEYYDIAKIRELVEAGRDRLAESAGIARHTLRVEFGGYRSEAVVEFWFVPAKGKVPPAKPDERPVPVGGASEEAYDPPN